MKLIFIILIISFGTSQAGEKTDILKIFQHFTLSSAAAGKCIKTKEEELKAFLSNYQMVSVHALQAIKKRKPELTKAEASQFLKTGGDRATQAVYSEIEESGCSSPKIQDLIKRFHMQAKWNPLKNG